MNRKLAIIIISLAFAAVIAYTIDKYFLSKLKKKNITSSDSYILASNAATSTNEQEQEYNVCGTETSGDSIAEIKNFRSIFIAKTNDSGVIKIKMNSGSTYQLDNYGETFVQGSSAETNKYFIIDAIEISAGATYKWHGFKK